MTNAERIAALRICANQTCCDNCPRYDIDHTQDAQRCCIELINDAADALESAEQRIAELEKRTKLPDRKDFLAKGSFIEEPLSKPKEGEWIVDKKGYPQIICSLCDVHIPMVAGWCMDAHINYCPNCGARMKGEDK